MAAGETIEVNAAHLRDLVSRWDAAKREERELHDAIVSVLGETAEVATVNGRPVVRYRPIAYSRFNAKKFREQYPELHDLYTVKSNMMRLDVNRKALGLVDVE